jgi:hypothetical protein
MAKKSTTKKAAEGTLIVASPNLHSSRFHIFGTSPYVQNKFSGTKMDKMLATQQATKGTSRKAREPRDIEADYLGAIYRTKGGKYGIPAPAFRCALISACRVAGLVMTKAKLSIFCIADDFDEDDGMPLVHLIAGEPECTKMPVRLESGVASIAIRPMWRDWEAEVQLQWDADQFSEQDVANLLERAGQQVAVGEGRHDSKKSNGMGWGTFSLVKP